MSNYKNMIKDELMFVVRFLTKNYSKIFSIIVSICLIIYLAAPFKPKSNQKEVPVNKPANINEKNYDYPFPNKKSRKKAKKSIKSSFKKKLKKSKLEEGNPSNQNN